MVKVDCSDLLGNEWVVGKSDCLFACVDLLVRAGMERAAESLVECVACGAPSGSWVVVSDEILQVGDVILSRGGDGGLHTSAVCDEGRGLAISSAESHGIFAMRYTRIQGVIEVYRYEG